MDYIYEKVANFHENETEFNKKKLIVHCQK